MSKEPLRFDLVYLDTVTIGPGPVESVDFFQDGHAISPDRIVQLTEQEIVSWILANERFRDLFFSKIGETPGPYLDSVSDNSFPLTLTPQGGDIDFLMLDGGNPSRALCVEFKKVKVRVDPHGNERVNNLSGFETLIKQGNRRQSQGFRKTFICAIAVIDAHEFRTPNVLIRGMESQDAQAFYDLGGIEGIHDDVGILLIEIPQPTGKSFHELSGFKICRVKEAKVLEQPSRLNDDLRNLFRAKSGAV
jgi:hypothetical protein